jgi:DNA-binding IclR family transcriptional regulator
MSSPESAPRYAAPALTKGLRLLEVLAASPAAMSQAELARSLNKSSAEIFRMLTVLGQEGYVRRGAQGAYLPTLKLFALGRTVDPLRALLDAAAGPMREFARQTGQECHLSMLEEGRLVVLVQESGTAAVSIRIREGSQHDPRATASGRLLLALLPAAEADRQIRLARARFGKSAPGMAVLRREMKKIAAAGYSGARHESRAGLADTAVPVRGPGPWTHAALASSHFIAEIPGSRVKEILRLLRAAAARAAAECQLETPHQPGKPPGPA